MGFLAPLYVAGVLAVGLPILFHLIRRAPQGRQEFSSLMFLQASPPRLTKRSRLTNILLLILRAAALILLALAFARPFFSNPADAGNKTPGGRRIALAIDTSASMRRGDLWRQAVDQADRLLADVTPADEVGLFLFDRNLRPAMTFAEWNETDPSRRVSMMKSRLAAATPTWDATRLGEALAAAADLVSEGDGGKQAATDKNIRQVVLISDLQQGGHAEALQGHQWPANVMLDVRAVAPKPAGNAGLQLVKPPADGSDKADHRLRVRVDNQSDSTREQFELVWADKSGVLPGEAYKAYVPPGRSQVVRVPWPKADERTPDRLVLKGDDADFDNTLYVVPPRRDDVRLVYIGEDIPEDVKGLLYYLKNAAAETPQRQVDLVVKRPADAIEPDLLGARAAVVTTPPADERIAALRQFAEGGGDVLWVMKDAGASAAGAARLMGVDTLKAEEATGSNFALVSRVDTEHPMFAPFADPRFGDFTKIHFWHHRRLNWGDAAGIRAIASFDGGDPFLVERLIGKGRILIATSGWQPADSQLALSTKFVPLVDGLLRRRDGAIAEASYPVHEAIPLPIVTTGPAGAADAAGRAVIDPDGKRIELPTTATTFDGADRPGVYRIAAKGEETPVAVNLSPDESRTAPVTVEELEQWGARLGTKATPADEAAVRQRRLELAERENRQKLWRWLIVGVLGLLAAETALAGRLAHRDVLQQQAPT